MGRGLYVGAGSSDPLRCCHFAASRHNTKALLFAASRHNATGAYCASRTRCDFPEHQASGVKPLMGRGLYVGAGSSDPLSAAILPQALTIQRRCCFAASRPNATGACCASRTRCNFAEHLASGVKTPDGAWPLCRSWKLRPPKMLPAKDGKQFRLGQAVLVKPTLRTSLQHNFITRLRASCLAGRLSRRARGPWRSFRFRPGAGRR